MASKKKIVLVVVLALLVVFTTGCGAGKPTEDPSVKITEIAATVQAELTQIALLNPSATPTFTPTVTATPSPVTPTLSTPLATITKTLSSGAMNGDNAKFDKDVTIPDYSLIKPGTKFVKTWSILNNGTTTWTKDYQLIYLEGLQDETGALFVKLTKDVKPGELLTISVNFTAPAANGMYTSWWKMYSANGYAFGEPVSLLISVGNETATPTSNAPTATVTVTTVVPPAP